MAILQNKQSPNELLGSQFDAYPRLEKILLYRQIHQLLIGYEQTSAQREYEKM